MNIDILLICYFSIYIPKQLRDCMNGYHVTPQWKDVLPESYYESVLKHVERCPVGIKMILSTNGKINQGNINFKVLKLSKCKNSLIS